MRIFILCPTIVLTAALLTNGCSKKHEAGKTESVPGTVLKGISMETVKSAAMPEMLEVVGSVRARTSALVSTRIPGSISVLRVREGDRVKKGQLLAELDAPENQATAAVGTAVIEEARRTTPVETHWETPAQPVLQPEQIGHLVAFTREALSNAIRHAQTPGLI